jgi:hypothetical protein
VGLGRPDAYALISNAADPNAFSCFSASRGPSGGTAATVTTLAENMVLGTIGPDDVNAECISQGGVLNRVRNQPMDMWLCRQHGVGYGVNVLGTCLYRYHISAGEMEAEISASNSSSVACIFVHNR